MSFASASLDRLHLTCHEAAAERAHRNSETLPVAFHVRANFWISRINRRCCAVRIDRVKPRQIEYVPPRNHACFPQRDRLQQSRQAVNVPAFNGQPMASTRPDLKCLAGLPSDHGSQRASNCPGPPPSDANRRYMTQSVPPTMMFLFFAAATFAVLRAALASFARDDRAAYAAPALIVFGIASAYVFHQLALHQFFIWHLLDLHAGHF